MLPTLDMQLYKEIDLAFWKINMLPTLDMQLYKEINLAFFNNAKY